MSQQTRIDFDHAAERSSITTRFCPKKHQFSAMGARGRPAWLRRHRVAFTLMPLSAGSRLAGYPGGITPLPGSP